MFIQNPLPLLCKFIISLHQYLWKVVNILERPKTVFCVSNVLNNSKNITLNVLLDLCKHAAGCISSSKTAKSLGQYLILLLVMMTNMLFLAHVSSYTFTRRRRRSKNSSIMYIKCLGLCPPVDSFSWQVGSRLTCRQACADICLIGG